MKVTYRGPAHTREISPSDLRKFGIEGHKPITIQRGETIVVNKDVAAILYNFGAFDHEGVEEVSEDTQPIDPEANGGELNSNTPPEDAPKTPTSKKAKDES
jgi:hypothetical protein